MQNVTELVVTVDTAPGETVAPAQSIAFPVDRISSTLTTAGNMPERTRQPLWNTDP